MRFILLALSILALSASAQKKYADRKINGYHDGAYLTLNVLSLADLGLPTIQPGMEYKLNDRWGIEGAFGIPLNYGLRKARNDSTYTHFYKLRGTLRYYIYYHTGYLGFETFYTHAKYTQYDYGYSDKNNQYYRSDFAQVNRAVYGFDFKYAWIFRIGRKLFIETFAGLGPRFVTVSLPINKNPTPTSMIRGGELSVIHLDQVGTRNDAYFTLGLQFVYRL